MKQFLIALSVITLFAAPSTYGFGSKDTVLVKVGRTKITKTDFESRIAQYPQESQAALQRQENQDRLLDQMVDEEVLYQQAKKLGYHRKKELKQQLENSKKQLLIAMLVKDKVDQNIAVTPQEIQAYYQQNPAQFAALETRSLSHILVKTKAEANKINRQLRKGVSFEKLAKKHSIDPTKENGGSLGWVRKDNLVPEFGNAGFAIKRNGRRSGVVKSQFGFHIIKLNDKKMRPEIKLNEAKDQIANVLSVQKQQVLFKQLLDDAKKRIKVKRNADNEASK
ncbi:peptidylprolyl isomerase [bacterium]|jgi:peptidyl-prolyl cis-trans isomerase C|nr:peptidylprolyl isomerase [bacterium]